MYTAFGDLTVPVDRSATAQRGVNAAIRFARRGARLHFCSVVNAGAAACGGSIGTPFDPTPIIDALESDAREICAEAVALARSSGIDADAVVLFGPVVPAIRDYASESKSDAIVIGTHARRGATRMLLGSVAESLMTTCDSPVLVAHTDDALENDGPIAVAIDDTLASRAVLDAAVTLARAQSRELALINVVEAHRSAWNASSLVLNDAGDVVRAADVAFESLALQGHAPETIVQTAERLRSPLIIMGTSGRTGAARLVLGSVAAGVVERAHVPVMVVRQH